MTAKIKLNTASGGGSFSLQAPSSSANNRVFTLPDVADATMATVNGITMAQMWRVHTIYTATAGDFAISSNWEAADEASTGYVGSSMSESSGVFTFPTTGIYLIHLNVNYYSSADRRFLGAGIQRTIDNSNYFYVALNYSNIEAQSGISHQSVATSCIFDVSDTSTHKVKFFTSIATGDTAVYASSEQNRTWAKFVRLGDT